MRFTLSLVVGAAVLRALSLPGWFDFSLPWLIIPAIILRIAMLRRRLSYKYEYLCGVLFWCFAFWFLHNVLVYAVPAAALIMGSTFVVEAWVFRKLNDRYSAATSACFALPACEFVRMKWFYLAVGGVPWASFGFPLADSAFLPFASSIGESGLVIVAVSLAAAIYSLHRKSAATPIFVVVILVMIAATTTKTVPPSISKIDCLVIQPSVSVHDKNSQMFLEEFSEIQYNLSVKAMQAHPDFELLLWAETMWPLPAVPDDQTGTMRRPWPGRDDEVIDIANMNEIQRISVKNLMAGAPKDSYFLTGAHFYQPAAGDEYSPRSTEFLLFDTTGHLLQHFSKSKLVPFGETLPFMNKFPGSEYLCDLSAQYFGLRPDFVMPEDTGPLQAQNGIPALGGAVCWENVFEQPFRDQAAAGAEAFAVLSNEDWLGSDGLEMTQMIAASKLRAAETGRSLLRATNTGQTCMVHPNGEVELGPEIMARDFWLAKLPLTSAKFTTTYTNFGWLLAPFWAIICLIMLVRNIFCQTTLDANLRTK